MPRFTNVKTSFSSGEISPRSYTRIDQEFYANACREVTNFFVTPQGGVVLRQGTRFLGDMNMTSIPTTVMPRLIPVRLGGTQDDRILTIEESNLSVSETMLWDTTGSLYAYGSLPAHKFEINNFSGLYYAQRHNLLVIVDGFQPPQIFTFDDNWRLDSIRNLSNNQLPAAFFKDEKSPDRGRSVYEIDFASITPMIDRYNVFINQNLTSINLNYAGSADVIEQAETSAVLINAIWNGLNLQSSDPARLLITVTHLSAEIYEVVFNSPYEMTRFDAENSDTGSINQPVVAQTLASFGGSEPAWSYPLVVTNGGNYYQSLVSHISEATNEPGVGATWASFWTDLGITAPAWEVWQPSIGWVIDTPYGVWDRGFPTTCVFHDQRLIFGGTKDLPTTVWGSAIGDFESFKVGVNDDEPFSYSLESSNSPRIVWLESQRGLAIGTTDGDWLLSADVTITPTSVQASRFTGRKSLNERPLTFGNEIFYIDQSSAKIRRVYYQRDSFGYENDDITFFAEHLGRKGIRRLAQMLVPESMIFALTHDNDLIVAAYDRLSDVKAWSRVVINDANGLVSAIGDITYGFGRERGQSIERATDVIYMAVRRGIGGWGMELLPYAQLIEDNDEPYADTIHLDNWSELSFAGATSGTTDSKYFGSDVSVLAQVKNPTPSNPSGYVYLGEFFVNGAGLLDLVNPAWGVQIGYRFNGKVRTVEVAIGSSGVTLGHKIRWNKLSLRLYNSSVPLINGQRPATKHDAAPMDNPPELFSGDVRVHDTGWDDGSVTIEQDLPYPVHVTGLFGQVGTHEA